MSLISVLKILLLVNSSMQISNDVNEPFMIKLCDDPNKRCAVYLLILMISMLFVEQISRQVNFFAENISNHLRGKEKD